MTQYRQLFENVAGDPVRPLDGLLPDPNLHPVRPDCHHLVGLFLAQQGRHAGPRLPRRHHRADHDYSHVIYQRCLAKDFLRQIHRHFPRHVLRHGLRFAPRQVFPPSPINADST